MESKMNIFLDVNVIVDILDSAGYDNKLAKEVLRILRLAKRSIYVSPTTFAISFYIFSKRNKSRVNTKKILIEFFKHFKFTTENQEVMSQVFNSNFDDLEVALQFFSAKLSEVKVIITKNKKDFIDTPGIQVYHPEEFIRLYYKM